MRSWFQLLHASYVLIFLSAISSLNLSSAATVFISANHSLTGGQTITSENGNFVLGFFSPGNSRNYYMGIWYGKISKQTAVWVANREAPLADTFTSEIKISGDGNIVLYNHRTDKILWSTNISATSNSTVAVLHDSGNLVLTDGSNSSGVLWQSFDHPTHTWLPGGRLGLNKVTGQNRILTSWKNTEDPSPGIYSLAVNPNGTSEYFIKWNGSESFWTSGPWKEGIFANVPEMMSHYLYTFYYVENDKEKYFTYSVQSTDLITRTVMDISGQIQQLTWLDDAQTWILLWSQPKLQCDVYSLCGQFGVCDLTSFPYCSCPKGFGASSQRYRSLGDYSGGCVRESPLQCVSNASSNSDLDEFYRMSDVRLPSNSWGSDAWSMEECESACLSDCSCTAYSYDNDTCSMWHEGLLNLQQLHDGASGSANLYLRLAASEFSNSKSKKWVTEVAIISVGGSLLAISTLLVIIWLLIRRRRARRFSKLKIVEGSLVPFKYSDLQRVTKNFSQKIGGGGFGSVFKGLLPDSTVIAVKVLEGISQGEKQFRAEVSTVGKIQHINLVRLFGFCSEGAKRLLVYEYMPMGSLAAALFRESSVPLDWNTRYQIVLGIARGLAYLHEKCIDCIIHCDIKPENILLDANFVPKVTDFGLAKLIGRDFSRVLTTVRGTIGYLAPEWISGVPVTAKADVYSYGMLIFEIISGERSSVQSEEGRCLFFPLLVASKLVKGQVLELIDRRLEGDANSEELDRLCRIALWCIQDDEAYRPSMGQIVQILEGALEVNIPLIPRSLRLLASSQKNIVFYS